jgi:hypothetical protein
MDKGLLVDKPVALGQNLLVQLALDGFPIAVALWVKSGEEGLWRLYIASPRVDPAKPGGAYQALYASLSRLSAPKVDFSEIKLIPAGHPIARDALELLGRCSEGYPIRLFKGSLGDLVVEEAYIYPPRPALPRPPQTEKRKLKEDVQQEERFEDLLLTREEKSAAAQLVARGIAPQQAEEWVRKKRQKQQPRPPIPAGTVVETWVAAYWGDKPEDDPNPLLTVEAPDGARGLAFKQDTEPA